jgi:hypothetical protein
MSLRKPGNRTRSAPLALISLAAFAVAAGGQEKAPRNPPEPFRVFVHTDERVDAALKAKLEEVLPMVRERVKRRGRWFQLADSPETGDIVLRITHYRQANLNLSVKGSRTESMYDCWATGYHYVDAVALAGDLRAPLSGLDHRCVETGPSLRNAASHLAEELERFAKDNYGALSRLRAGAEVGERADGGAPPMQPGN